MKRLTIDYVREQFETRGCKLLSTEYLNAHQNLDYVCSCGNQSQITWNSFQQGHGCNQCGQTKTHDSQRHSIDFVREVFKSQGCELLSDSYTNSNTLLDYRCSCGNISKIAYANFQSGNRCKKCGFERTASKLRGRKYPEKSGANNINYNHNLTPEERLNSRNRNANPENSEWRTAVYQRDNYTCKCCGERVSGTLEAHHYYGYTEFPEYRFRLDNGITLCEDCHKEYHQKEGYKGNSKVQFFLFLWNKKLLRAG